MGRLYHGTGGRIETAGALGASSKGTVLSAAGSANAKGAYAQLIASTLFDADAILVTVHADTIGAAWSALIDIAIGAAASEVIIVPDILWSIEQWAGRPGSQLLIPCKIPAGSRVAARLACTDTGTGAQLTIHLINLGGGIMHAPGGKVVSYGTASGSSGGTSVDPGATANTKGAYSQIVAPTNEDLSAICILVGSQNAAKTVRCNALIDIAIGAAASEVIVIADYPIGVDENAELYMPVWGAMIPCVIPAGSRIAARAQNSTNSASNRVFDIAILGVT